eukprot:8648829-Alexandrium_andersonii.AAC.1
MCIRDSLSEAAATSLRAERAALSGAARITAGNDEQTALLASALALGIQVFQETRTRRARRRGQAAGLERWPELAACPAGANS